MKKIGMMALMALMFSSFVYGQKYAYVNTEYILSNIPEYDQAQKQIDETAITWQKDIEAKFSAIDALYKKYQNDAPLLTEDMKNRRENEIIQKEKEAKDLQKKRFGNDGDLFKRRQELIRPIQDKVYNAIEKRAQQKQFVFVFDRADNSNILYADSKIDISNDVLKDMGYTPDAKKKNTIDIGGSTKPNEINTGIKLGN
ncbi:MAG: OmpH family outer membrane protein [Bacteroidales bacterium]